MPTIRPYQTQESAQGSIGGRAARSTDFYVPSGAGDALGDFGKSLAEDASRQEVSDVRVNMAKYRAERTVELAKRQQTVKPGDTKWLDDFTAETERGLEALGADIRTSAGTRAFKESSAGLAADMLQSAGLYQAQLVGKKAVQDYYATTDARRNTLLTDPSQFDRMMQETERDLTDPNSAFARIPPAQREELKRKTMSDMAKSALQGMIRVNPEAALGQIKNDKYGKFLDADLTAQLEGAAKTGIRAERLDEELRKKAVEEERKKRVDAITGGWLASVAEGNYPSVKDIALSPDLDSTEKNTWISHISTLRNREAALDNPVIVNDLFRRIVLPEGTEGRIADVRDLDPYVGKGVSLNTLDRLRREVLGTGTPEGKVEAQLKAQILKTARSELSGASQFFRDPKGEEGVLGFMNFFLPEYERQRRNGKTPQELLDPKSKDYLGSSINRFKRPFDQVLRDLIPMVPSDTMARPKGVPADAKRSGQDGKWYWQENGKWRSN